VRDVEGFGSIISAELGGKMYNMRYWLRDCSISIKSTTLSRAAMRAIWLLPFYYSWLSVV
jgi:hypothetical protein